MNAEAVESQQPCTFSQVADAYLEMHREGKSVSIEELAVAFPHLAAEIRSKLPTMGLLDGALRDGLAELEQTIGGCLIEAEIGRGACGVVYRAHHSELRREVAVKVMRTDPTMARRFELEGQALARLNHPNIVPVYAFEQLDSLAYLVMKLADGFSFAQLVRGDCDHYGMHLLSTLRNDWKEFAKVAHGIVSALEHAHEHNLVHRDIKPANLMLDREGHVWVADFGLVKAPDLMQSLSITGDIIGTPRYMSPEQLRGACDARSDIYSLGISLFELATGKLPTMSRQSSESNVDSDQGSVDVPRQLMSIIEKASALSPEDRYQSASEMKHVLERFIADKVPDRRNGRRKPDDVFRREFRKKLTVAFSVPLLFGLIAGLGYFAFSSARSTDVAQKTVLPTTLSDQQLSAARSPKPNQVGLSAEESKAFVNGVNAIMEGLETGELSDDDITGLAQSYRGSNLSLAARIMRVGILFHHSKLTDAQKMRGVRAVEKLSRLVASGQVQESQAIQLLNDLTGGRKLPVDPREKIEVNDRQLARWIVDVERTTADHEVKENDLANEVNRLFSALPNVREPEKPQPITRERIESVIDKLPSDFREQAIEQLKRVRESQ